MKDDVFRMRIKSQDKEDLKKVAKSQDISASELAWSFMQEGLRKALKKMEK